MAEPKPPPSILAPIIIFVGIFALVLLVPPLGLFVSVILPTPIILIYLAKGRRAGWFSAAALFCILLALAGLIPALVFLGEFVVVAFILAETINASLSFEKCIFYSAAGAAVISLTLMFSVHEGGEKSDSELFQEQIKKHIDKAFESMEDADSDQADVETMRKIAEEVSIKLGTAYPAILVVGLLFKAIVNFIAVMFMWPRFYGTALFSSVEFSKLILPDPLVWPLILSGAAMFFASGGLQVLGINILLLLLVVYFLQGAMIVLRLLQSKNAPVFLRVIIFVIVITQPLFIGILIGMGIFDLWVDFRKIRVSPPAVPE